MIDKLVVATGALMCVTGSFGALFPYLKTISGLLVMSGALFLLVGVISSHFRK